MPYPTTVDILWGRLRGGLNGPDYSEWATGLLVEGNESGETVILAGHSDLHWQERETIFLKILAQLDIALPQTVDELCEEIKKRELSRYVSGEIDGIELVHAGYELWLNSDYSPRFEIWANLDEDIALCKTEYGPLFYQIDPDNIERSIATILEEKGYIHR